ncbi:hypothetical protein S40288_06711 [Stachybotrys chartarum IBT 40288]|nr:hypothetical protein S40288_06711 [Stachybotrys chartarum IBT 40288]
MPVWPNRPHEQATSDGARPATPQMAYESGETRPSQPPRGQKRPLAATALRTAVACRACRDRKTRCSGHQPTCRYCAKAGLVCEYNAGAVVAPLPGQSSVSLDEWGDKILRAVDTLAEEIHGSRLPLDRSCSEQSSSPWYTANVQNGDGEIDDEVLTSTAMVQSCSKRRRISPKPQRLGTITIPEVSFVTGLSSILTWSTFSASHNSALESASCTVPELHALIASFTAHFLPSMPVVDLEDTRRLVVDIGEYGVAWTANSCLILLIAALGSICQIDHPCARQQLAQLAPNRANGRGGYQRQASIAKRYWNMARKRLTWATDASGLLAGQCHFLAGILAAHKDLQSWHAELPPHLRIFLGPDSLSLDQVAGPDANHDGRQQLRYSYRETEELILRPSLFLLLHVQCLQRTRPDTEDRPETLKHVLEEHITAQLRKTNVKHRAALLSRLQLCLEPNFPGALLLEIGWLRRQTCAALSLLSIASDRACDHYGDWVSSGTAPLDGMVALAEEFFIQDSLCSDTSQVYLDLLRQHRSQRT